MRSLAEERSIIIKKAVKRSCSAVWDRADCLHEAEKQLAYSHIYMKKCFLN